MKRFLIYLISITTLMIIFGGCHNNSQPPSVDPSHTSQEVSDSTTTISTTATANNDTNQYESFDLYGLSSTTNATPFAIAMSQNPIDPQWEEQFCNAGSTEELCKVELRFIDIWKGELAHSIECLKEVLTEEQGQELEKLQTDWETFTLNQLEFEKDIVNSYNSVGTSFRFTYLSEIRKQYRVRTFRIKYIHYLIECNDVLKESDHYISFQFFS